MVICREGGGGEGVNVQVKSSGRMDMKELIHRIREVKALVYRHYRDRMKMRYIGEWVWKRNGEIVKKQSHEQFVLYHPHPEPAAVFLSRMLSFIKFSSPLPPFLQL